MSLPAPDISAPVAISSEEQKTSENKLSDEDAIMESPLCPQVDDEDLHFSSIFNKLQATNMRPSMRVPVTVNKNLRPVLQNVASLFEPITNELWDMKGFYNNAVESNNEISFKVHNGKQTLHVLCVETSNINTTAAEETISCKPFTPYESTLASVLKVLMDLTRQHPPKDLPGQYHCYCTVSAALDQMAKISKWPDRPPTEKQVIELFIGKSQWSNMWCPTFKRAAQYFPKMSKWLNGDSDSMTAVELWGDDARAAQYFPKMSKWLNGDSDSMTAVELWGDDARYTLKILQEWMDNDGKMLKKEKVVGVERKVRASSSKNTSEQEKSKKKKTKKQSEQ
ncbi:hypothetical protein CVT25_013293 [Psilocybe cyanescens]|uniref:Uncharacterized protein n=1 Tax=Psilocybe cyanescens TaxID=93625 RepID=A0A409XWL2_PSICY|nr:hypothetical protein CVT25_013293 [Psilocybe cyanescens]